MSDKGQTEGPALGRTVPGQPPFRVLSILIGGAVLLGGLAIAASQLLGGDGRLRPLADPDGAHVALVHAEAAGVGDAIRSYEQALTVCGRKPTVPTTGPMGSVTYVVQTGGTMGDIARIYGMPVEPLMLLNKKEDPGEVFVPGSNILLYKPGVALSEIDYGTPERLYAGVPLPDGPGRRIRRRRVSWGTSNAVFHLDASLARYGSAYPDGPVVIVSDMSRRDGGRLPPHHTHRTGRDVDLSYIPKPDQDNGGFMVMNSWAFDRERNWAFLDGLLDTGQVELVLMDTVVQRMLVTHLRGKVPEERLRQIFQYPAPPTEETGIVRHWDGHRDHMHVRFKCGTHAPGCP